MIAAGRPDAGKLLQPDSGVRVIPIDVEVLTD
jgi:hypothetical protein